MTSLCTPSTENQRTRVKICGLTREQDVDAAVAAGADAVGFVLYEKSARFVTIERAVELARRHYQKARDLGAAPDPLIEKALR